MTPFPILETERLVLRQIAPEDSRDLFHYFSLDEVTKFYDLESFTNIKQAEELIDRWQQRFEKNLGVRWGITLKSENRLIGTCGYHGWMKHHYKAEIGYELTPEYWGKGFMTEAIQKAIEYGFHHLELNRIEAFVVPENVNSRKVLGKAGFREEGILKEHFFWRNRFVDTAIFALLKRDYNVR
ncbi:GNAT family N-acetyltransferase [Paenibacillus sp. XY044]|uniref:GNAT family N-acetyltransferase n=1 Tax=Paenibacillus sp. XY044 TaxID=2026089 RepID=UPI000B980716|nr:GNAT family protein [Paenibacillus sp. XY044]OZB96167.1 GNAT family N-acetyltransferase [Paenibacillus sp. XY044]